VADVLTGRYPTTEAEYDAVVRRRAERMAAVDGDGPEPDP
jgi:hypothetical protein